MAEAPELFVSASVPAFAVGAGTESGTGPAKSAIQELIISTLDIPTHLTDRSIKVKIDIRMAYAKYLALLDTIRSMSKLVTSGTWTHKTVSNDDIIEIFMSKSAYFKNHSKIFTMVNRYPQMEKWLLNADDAPPDFEVWGYQKHTFEVLRSILSKREVPSSSTPVDRKGKGKEKADLDLSSSPEEKKKKKGTAKTVKGKKKADTSSRKGRKKEEGSGKASTSKTQ